MNPSTINTILNSAPMVIQGASKLIKLIKEQAEPDTNPDEDTPHSIESLQKEIQTLEQKLARTDDSTIQQIKLIEELAKQNEGLALALSRNQSRLNILTFSVAITAGLALLALLLILL